MQIFVSLWVTNGQGPSATHKMLKTSIFDGAMYKSISAPNDPKLANISVSWNVDGVPIFKSSPFHIWPLQVTINELPPNLRAKRVILGGLWFGPRKPEVNSFLQ